MMAFARSSWSLSRSRSPLAAANWSARPPIRRATMTVASGALMTSSVARTRLVQPAREPTTAAVTSSSPPRTRRVRAVRGPGSLYLSVGRFIGQPPVREGRVLQVLRIGAAPVSPGAPGLAEKPNPFDDHPSVDGFDHVINCQARHTDG